MNRKTPDEQPKKTVAKKVVTPKRRYFVPGQGSIEATSIDGAVKGFHGKEVTKKVEEGDGNR